MLDSRFRAPSLSSTCHLLALDLFDMLQIDRMLVVFSSFLENDLPRNYMILFERLDEVCHLAKLMSLRWTIHLQRVLLLVD